MKVNPKLILPSRVKRESHADRLEIMAEARDLTRDALSIRTAARALRLGSKGLSL